MQRHDRMAAIAAALILVLAMGFGRFAFTGLYPSMVEGDQITLSGGSYAASANYAGYLVGALLAALLMGIPARILCSLSVITTIAWLALLGFPLPEWLLVTLRGFAGISSAVGMVAASHWLIQEHRQHDAAPAMFAGVGAGILISAELIALANVTGLSSFAAWLVLAAVSLVIAVPTLLILRARDASKVSATKADDAGQDAVSLGALRLIVIYGLAGLGYIITATYLPLLLRSTIGNIDPVHVWAIFGLSAIPSCFFWHALHLRMGTKRSLALNLALQAAGVVLPLIHAPAAYILSALLVGGTFMGTVTIAVPAARRVASSVRFNILAVMTASYGIGQIVGPLAANAFYGLTQTFDASLMAAGGALLLAAGLAIIAPASSKA